jgi:hypothetical protein
MKRIVSVLAVAALMAVMMVASALPAFAAVPDDGETANFQGQISSGADPGPDKSRDCFAKQNQGSFGHTRSEQAQRPNFGPGAFLNTCSGEGSS